MQTSRIVPLSQILIQRWYNPTWLYRIKQYFVKYKHITYIKPSVYHKLNLKGNFVNVKSNLSALYIILQTKLKFKMKIEIDTDGH